MLNNSINMRVRGLVCIAISPLLLPVETQYVLPSYRKSLSRNPLMLLVLAYDLLIKVIFDLIIIYYAIFQKYRDYIKESCILPEELVREEGRIIEICRLVKSSRIHNKSMDSSKHLSVNILIIVLVAKQ